MKIRYIDLFCGIGGFHFAMQNAAEKLNIESECLFASDIDPHCRHAYEANFQLQVAGDITKIDASDIPDHDVLLAGFPCQPFSIIGKKQGFEDTRGTLFFDIARILAEKKPALLVLENVKQLVGHNHGQTLQVILSTLKELGYHVEFRVLDALQFGLPQKRQRVWIIGSRLPVHFAWPTGEIPMTPLSEILEKDVPERFFASQEIQSKRLQKQKKTSEPTIWHENKSGHVSAHPFSCALRAGASYNYLLVNGERRFTPREMLRLQGFPESFKIVSSESQLRKQAGNSLPVNVATSVIQSLLSSRFHLETQTIESPEQFSLMLNQEPKPYGKKSSIKNR